MKFDMQAARICAATNGADTRISLKAALDRITELEGIVVEERAISIHNFQRYEAAIGEGHISGFDHRQGWDDMPEEQRKAIIEIHREMLHKEGKLSTTPA